MTNALKFEISRVFRNVQSIFGYDVFISYHHSDGEFYARRLQERLTKNLSIFRDEEQIDYGESLTRRITKALRRTRVLVSVLTPTAYQSRWISRELECFRSAGGNRVIAVFLPGTDRNEWLEFADYRHVDDVSLDNPSGTVLTAIRDSTVGLRRRTISRNFIAVGSVALLALVIFAVATLAGAYSVPSEQWMELDIGARHVREATLRYDVPDPVIRAFVVPTAWEHLGQSPPEELIDLRPNGEIIGCAAVATSGQADQLSPAPCEGLPAGELASLGLTTANAEGGSRVALEAFYAVSDKPNIRLGHPQQARIEAAIKQELGWSEITYIPWQLPGGTLALIAADVATLQTDSLKSVVAIVGSDGIIHVSPPCERLNPGPIQLLASGPNNEIVWISLKYDFGGSPFRRWRVGSPNWEEITLPSPWNQATKIRDAWIARGGTPMVLTFFGDVPEALQGPVVISERGCRPLQAGLFQKHISSVEIVGRTIDGMIVVQGDGRLLVYRGLKLLERVGAIWAKWQNNL